MLWGWGPLGEAMWVWPRGCLTLGLLCGRAKAALGLERQIDRSLTSGWGAAGARQKAPEAGGVWSPGGARSDGWELVRGPQDWVTWVRLPREA